MPPTDDFIMMETNQGRNSAEFYQKSIDLDKADQNYGVA